MFSALPITKKAKTRQIRKTASFMEPTHIFTYYEDLHGQRNREEFDEGSIHSCNSDSDEERIRKPSKKRAPDRFFQQFSTSKGKKILPNSDRFGVIKTPGKKRSFFNSPASSRHSILPTSPTPNDERSPSANTSKNLTPRKFGLFASPMATMQVDDSAVEMMDILDGPRYGTPGLQVGNGDEKEMRQDTPVGQSDTERVSLPPNPYQVDKLAVRAVSGVNNEELLPEAGGEMGGDGSGGDRGRSRVALTTTFEGESDGDVEDNASELDGVFEKYDRTFRARELRADANNNAVAIKKTQPTKLKYRLRRKVLKGAATSSAASTSRRSARHSKVVKDDRKKKNGGIARSPATRAKRIAASNRSRMTARAVSLRKKAKKTDRATAEDDYYQAVYGRKRKAQKQTDTTADEKDAHYRAVDGRQAKTTAEDVLEQYEYEPEYSDIIPRVVAKAMEQVGGVVEVDLGDVDVEEYERTF